MLWPAGLVRELASTSSLIKSSTTQTFSSERLESFDFPEGIAVLREPIIGVPYRQ